VLVVPHNAPVPHDPRLYICATLHGFDVGAITEIHERQHQP
jgi:hypothetical protein